MSFHPPRLSQAQQQWLNTQLPSGKFESLTLLAGDGSTRSFYRASHGKESAIVVVDSEWEQTKDYSAHNNFLRLHSVPTPQFFGENATLGLLVMEDLGDTLLQVPICKNSPDKMALLENVVSILADLHGKTFPVPQTIPASQRSFDSEKLMQEFKYSELHLVQKFLGLPAFTPSAIQSLEQFCKKIASIAPNVFTHRDFHTRNILYKNGNLFLIDFQDARMGPPHYDLASFLYDPYVPLGQKERDHLRKSYEEHLKPYELYGQIDWKSFDENLEIVALQRLVKAAGSFASFHTRFGKKTHLPYLIPALKTALSLSCASEMVSALPLKHWLETIEKARLTE